MTETILEVKDLVTSFQLEDVRARAVDKVSFRVRRGATLGVVGESGCGKSVTALSIMRLLPQPSGRIESGQVLYNGTDLVSLTAEKMHGIRGRRIGMIFQDPMTALNPVHKIGQQLAEVFGLHFPELSSKDVYKRCVKLLTDVGIAAPERRMQEYPHQLSGGMRQRVMIAIALACEPDILIADEPTTALDVTIQAQILDLIARLQKKNNMAVVFITHDLGVIAEISDDVLVMYGGRVVEYAPVHEIFEKPRHPYTKGLLRSMPRLDAPRKQVLEVIRGMVPTLTDMPAGCRFQNRCPQFADVCREPPTLKHFGPEHASLCHFD